MKYTLVGVYNVKNLMQVYFIVGHTGDVIDKQIKALHGLLLEFGETVRKSRASLYKAMPEVLERLKEKMPPFLIY